MFPNSDQRKLVVFANRYNGFLKPDMIIAVPTNLKNKSLYDISPLPLSIPEQNERILLINQVKMAWGAYNQYGKLIRWGPISAGTVKCVESSNCSTPTGRYRIKRKNGEQCFSNSLPLRTDGERGGAYMPYCMFFH